MKLTPLKAIRKKCLDCSGGSRAEVRECTIPDCSLYLYRLGKNPARKGMGSIQNLQDSQKLPTQLGVSDWKKMKQDIILLKRTGEQSIRKESNNH